jgi:hypothetical protein
MEQGKFTYRMNALYRGALRSGIYVEVTIFDSDLPKAIAEIRICKGENRRCAWTDLNLCSHVYVQADDSKILYTVEVSQLRINPAFLSDKDALLRADVYLQACKIGTLIQAMLECGHGLEKTSNLLDMHLRSLNYGPMD